jgi:Zn-dependent metalloprotease
MTQSYYLVAKGGTHHKSGITVTGIGADDAAKIWFRALTSYMTSTTATALFGQGSAQFNTVAQAWTAVGVN